MILHVGLTAACCIPLHGQRRVEFRVKHPRNSATNFPSLDDDGSGRSAPRRTRPSEVPVPVMHAKSERQLSLPIDEAELPPKLVRKRRIAAILARPREVTPAPIDQVLSTRDIVKITGRHRITIYRWIRARSAGSVPTSSNGSAAGPKAPKTAASQDDPEPPLTRGREASLI